MGRHRPTMTALARRKTDDATPLSDRRRTGRLAVYLDAYFGDGKARAASLA